MQCARLVLGAGFPNARILDCCPRGPRALLSYIQKKVGGGTLAKRGKRHPWQGWWAPMVGIICPAPAVVWCGQLEEKPGPGNPTSQVTILFQPTNTTTASKFINKI